MTTGLATHAPNGDAIMERVLLAGDLARLNPAERVRYYAETCRSLGLNPLTRPFEYITLNGKLTLYALKGATDQLRQLHGISITGLEESLSADGILTVTAAARTRDGRTDRDVGAVALAGLRGEALANARMRAITKSKRRVTLSICGLGWLDDSELDAIPDARRVAVDTTTGEIDPHPAPRALVQPARTRSREVPEGKRWSEADLAYFWGNLAALEPKVTPDELHAILGVESLHDWPDLDTALGAVFAARQAGRVEVLPPDDDPPHLDTFPHPEGSIEAEWERYTRLEQAAAAWNRKYPEQHINYADPPRDAPALQVRAYADGLERRLEKVGAP